MEPAGSSGSAGRAGTGGSARGAGTQGRARPRRGLRLFNWGDIANKPADLADGQIGWGEVANKPSGFNDGVDNEGVTSVKIRTVTSDTPTTTTDLFSEDTVDCPAGFLVVGGGYLVSTIPSVEATPWMIAYSNQAVDADTWAVSFFKPGSGTLSFAAQATCMRAEPGGLTIAAKNSDFGPKKARVRLPRK